MNKFQTIIKVKLPEGTHSTSYTMGKRGSPPEAEQMGMKLTTHWSYRSTPPYIFTTWYLFTSRRGVLFQRNPD